MVSTAPPRSACDNRGRDARRNIHFSLNARVVIRNATNGDEAFLIGLSTLFEQPPSVA
jgi:hypothetical protein